MAKLDDSQRHWGTGITRVEVTDRVLGGNVKNDPNAPFNEANRRSPVNYALQEIVNRLNYLRHAIDNFTIPAINAATTTVQGVARLATQQQVNAGSSDDTIVTPQTLQQKINDINIPQATTLVAGILELATVAEAEGLSAQFQAITPHLLRAALRGNLAKATTTYAGTVERLTNAEARLGNDTTRYGSISTLLDALRNGTPFRASETYRGTIELLNQAEARAATDNIRVPTILRILDALRNGTPFRATTSRYGTVEVASESDVANQQNIHRVLTVDSLYRQDTNLGTGDVSVTRLSGSLPTIASVSGGVVSYFGPIPYDATSITVQTNSFTSTSSTSFILQFSNKIAVENFNWSGTTTPGSTQVTITNINGNNNTIEVRNNTHYSARSYTITGVRK